MDSTAQFDHGSNLEMANEAFYRSQADSYRNSDEYNRMVNLYPVLKTTIGECENERFVA